MAEDEKAFLNFLRHLIELLLNVLMYMNRHKRGARARIL